MSNSNKHRFATRAIHAGQSPDPTIQGNDMIVVGSSGAKKFWRGVVNAAPVFSIFRPISGL